MQNNNSNKIQFKQVVRGSFSHRQIEDVISALALLIAQDPVAAAKEVDIDGSIVDLRNMLVDALNESKENPVTNVKQVIPVHLFCV